MKEEGFDRTYESHIKENEKMKKYIVLYMSEDGNVDIKYMTKEEIEDMYLSEGEYAPHFFDKLPNIGYDAGVLIIDGNIITPKLKEIITEWELE